MTAAHAADLPPRGPERDRHIDARITGLGAAEVLAAFGPAEVLAAFGPAAPADDIAALRRRLGAGRPALWPRRAWADSATAEQTAAVLAEAEALDPDTFDVTGSAYGRSQRYGFHYLRWLDPIAQAYLLTGDRRWVEAFDRLFLRWHADRNDYRGDWPGLDVVWYSLGTWMRATQMLHWLDEFADALSDEAWAALLANLIGGARWAHDEHDRFRHGNWQLVAASHLVQVADRYPELIEASAWTVRGRNRLRDHLELDVYPDGGHYERSPGYHEMCLVQLQIIAGIDLRGGTDHVLGHPRFAAMHDWLATLTGSGGWVPELQDSGTVFAAERLLHGAWLMTDPTLLATARTMADPELVEAHLADLPVLDVEHDRRWRELLAEPARPATARRARWLPESGYAVLPHPDHRAPRLLINAGHHIEHELESHSHRAVLDFVLDGWGEPLLTEAGTPPHYDAPAYQSFHQATAGHNTVQIDDLEVGSDRRLTGIDVWQTGDLVGFAGTHHGTTLSAGPIGHTRRVTMINSEPSLAVVADRLTPPDDGAHDYAFRLHACAPWRPTTSEDPVTSPYDHISGPVGGPDGPGVEVHLWPSDGDVTEAEHQARRPDRAAREANFEALHSLTWRRSTPEFLAVVLPRAEVGTAPARVTHTPEGPVLHHNRVVDHVTPTSVRRTDDEGRLIGWWAWDIRSLADTAPWLETDVPVTLELRPTADGHQLLLHAASRTRLHLSDALWDADTEVRLAGIGLEPGDPMVPLPYAGTWMVETTRESRS